CPAEPPPAGVSLVAPSPCAEPTLQRALRVASYPGSTTIRVKIGHGTQGHHSTVRPRLAYGSEPRRCGCQQLRMPTAADANSCGCQQLRIAWSGRERLRAYRLHGHQWRLARGTAPLTATDSAATGSAAEVGAPVPIATTDASKSRTTWS